LEFKKENSAVCNLTGLLAELYRKNWTAFNAIISEGGEADNVVAGKAFAKILMRPRNLKEFYRITAFLMKIKKEKVRVRITDKIKPCESSLIKNGILVPYFSEMAFFPNSLLFGVGDIKFAHTPNEFVNRKELNQLEEKLLQLIKNLEK
jgi:acetylornithine deacetylase/succinyl-diaminopimelate desuccinylase-like protein